MRPIHLFVTAFFACSIGIFMIAIASGEADPAPEVVTVESPTTPAPEPVRSWLPIEIEKGDTLGTLLEPYGIPAETVRAAALSLHDLASVRRGKTLDLLFEDDDPNAIAVRYELDEDHTLLVEAVDEMWIARVEAIEYEVHQSYREFQVDSTLWEAAIDVGMRARDIATLARVFEYDVDFNTEVQKGAAAKVLIEELWHEGQLAKLGVPWAARFVNKGKEYLAIRFTLTNGEIGYFDEQGRAAKRAFLRSPLAFSRVTSGFSLKRFHPVLKRSRPHYGVDYGAPSGTPVRAVGKGKVVTASVQGGHGKFVKIAHSGPYASSYSHLSKIRVKAGQTIKQGQIIGNVGSTGLATGPHLHYQFWKNGRYVNPLTVALPRTETIPTNQRRAFDEERDRLLRLLDEGEGGALAMELVEDSGLPSGSEATQANTGPHVRP